MKPVESSVLINGPLEACFAYLTDLGNDLEWRREWIAAEKRGEPRILNLAGPLIAGIGRRQVEGDFPKLKHLMESATS